MMDGEGRKPTVQMLSSKKIWDYAARPITFMRPQYTAKSGWHEHVPFAFWLTDVHRPQCIVELGCHYGVSYFAFCQAVQEIGLDARCYGVDTWKGDEHAGVYDESVFREVEAHNNAQYSGFSRLVRSTFDQALEHFSDGQIDLLHIDGHHSFDSVLHDFNSWLPKLSDRAVVIMHDTNVRERGFGVYQLFEELRRRYPGFAFLHGHGLGILGTGSDYGEGIKKLFSIDGSEDRLAFQELFSRMGRSCADAYWAKQRDIELAEEKKLSEGYKNTIDRFWKEIEEGEAQLQLERKERERVSTTISELVKSSEIVRQSLIEKKLELERKCSEHADAVDITLKLGKRLEAFVLLQKQLEEQLSQTKADAERKNLDSKQADETRLRVETEISQLRKRFNELESRCREHIAEIVKLSEMLLVRDNVLAGSKILKKEALLLIGKHVQSMLGKPSLPIVDRWREKRLARRLAKLGLFNSRWYLECYEDVAKAGIDPAIHYVRHGSKEGRSPVNNLDEIFGSFMPSDP
ncbi:class I SAM-dependent methyltransferase [Agrobacterium bohemicum]|uniref:Methyltransferase domain-containing protein n=1 Tax=Agrobacterium bohemicum TaxID=2052828 RepID=A0A135P7L4_9HYPH|nr:class I SAM-dependent methyltransferase [Agrobacterium bohemicum]KXG87403.1 hypothetical protein ATO67_18995 [Agrobacterium bohemicum]